MHRLNMTEVVKLNKEDESMNVAIIFAGGTGQINGHDVYTVEGSAENIKITTPRGAWRFRDHESQE